MNLFWEMHTTLYNLRAGIADNIRDMFDMPMEDIAEEMRLYDALGLVLDCLPANIEVS